ncbi:type VII secretion protein EccB [Streptomyces sp. NPDC058583]|uniref:type VII secretion protein EccB n=1 Tax=unclassified Streptomyces TaxID=2593676 RepID=UPI00365977C8
MQSRRDQVQAHLFLMGRLTSGMLRENPDTLETPGGRTNRGMAFGLIIGVVAILVSALWGLFSPGGSTSWRAEGTLVLEKDTGNRYVFAQGRLRPVLNYASARLLLNGDMKSATVGSSATKDAPHGPPVGIPGAPDYLPGRTSLLSSPWQVCAATTRQTSGEVVVRTRLALGAADGGRPLGSGEALLVQGPDGRRSLLLGGERHLLDEITGAATSLGYGSAPAHPVSAAFLVALPAAPDLAAPAVPGRGEAGPALDGRPTRVGQIFSVEVPGAEGQFHLLRREGLTPLTETETALVLGDPQTRKVAYEGQTPAARPLGAEAARGHLASAASRPAGGGLPASPPRLVQIPGGTEPCAVVRPSDGAAMGVSIAFAPAAVAEDHVAQPPADGVAPACLPVDRVEVPPGKGALIQALSSAGTRMGDTVFLVTDSGVRHPVAAGGALEALGYTAADVRGLPSALLMTLPTGAPLDPAAAAMPPAADSGAPRRSCPGAADTASPESTTGSQPTRAVNTVEE